MEDSHETDNDNEKRQIANKRLRWWIEEYLPLLINAFYILPLFIIPQGQYKVPAAAAVAIIGFIITMLISRRFRPRIKILRALEDKNGHSISEIKTSTGLSDESIDHHLERIRNYVTRNSKSYMVTKEGLQFLRQVGPRYSSSTLATAKPNEEAKRKFTLFFGMIYVFVASIAVGQALELFNEVSLSSMLSRNTINPFNLSILLTLIGFFLIAIPFVHAGVIYLATDASVDLTHGKAPKVLGNFTALFLQVTFLSFMAVNFSDVTNFIKLAIVLMLIDVIWVFIFLLKGEKGDVVFIEWLEFNLLGAIFLVVALFVIEPAVQALPPVKLPLPLEDLPLEVLPLEYHPQGRLLAEQPNLLHLYFIIIFIIIVTVLFFRTFFDYWSLWDEVYSIRILENF